LKRSFFFSTFLFAAVLSPITLQPYTCGPPPAEARLAVLELRVGDFDGENVIEGFDPDVFSYEARFPESESVGVLWVKTNHPSTMVDVEYDGLPVRLRGQSVAELDVPLESSEITIHVTRPGPAPDAKTYVVHIERVPIFPCTEHGIREAIARGGGPIFFDCDGPTVVPSEAEIAINNDVILDGEGNLIVDAGGGGAGGAGGAGFAAAQVAPKANGPHRVFSIEEGVTAELIGLTVTGGATAGDGGGILNAGVFTLADSTVTANSADRGGGVGNLDRGLLTIVSSNISDNTADLAGGVGTLGIAEIIDTRVSGNTAVAGGGGLGVATGGDLTVSGSVIEGNSTAGLAGGVGVEELATLTMNSTTLANNEAGSQSGGMENGGSASLNDCTVVGNRATIFNGAIGNSGVLTLNNTTVADNSVIGDGGGIGSLGVLTIRNSVVSGNSATGYSGGIGNSGDLMVIDSTVSDNSCGLDGGGIASFSGTTTLTNTAVSGNEAGNSGGGIQSFGDLTLIESAVSRNSADFSGGVFVGGVADLRGTRISDNFARFVAGGIGVATSDTARATMSNCLVVGNTAADRAGIANGGAITLVDSMVSRNTATDLDGGGILNDETATLLVTRSTVSENTAGRFGGGIRNLGVAEIIDTTVANNTSMQFTGGVSNRGTLWLTQVTVAGNFAAERGGGVGNVGTATLTNVTVSGNEAGDFAGGIRNGNFPTFGTLHLVSTTVSRNFAPNGASALGNDALVTMANTIIDGDCQMIGPAESRGGNIESPGNTCLLIPGIDLFNVPTTDLGLGPLANNGGPTQTQALAPFSVALDRISEPECVDANGLPLLTDQRGFPRPQGPACDSGAFELEDGTPPMGACINDADRTTYESLVYVDGQGTLWTCIDAATEIGNDCVFGSAQSEPPLEGCRDQAGDVIACFPNCPEEVIDAFGACVALCTARATGLSAGCANCYGEAAACGAAFCTFACAGGDLNSPPCISCRIENGCIPGFDACSGLPGDIDCGGTGGVDYAQDFESLDQMSPTALGDDGWLIFGQVVDGDGVFKFDYGPFPAPNGTPGFSSIVAGEGGPEQGGQQLVTYSDYNCCDPNQGHRNGTDRVTSLVFQEPFTEGSAISVADVGKTLEFSFDARRGDINEPMGTSMAQAFIQTVDPSAGFVQTNFVSIDMTNLPVGIWDRYSISLTIDAGLVGQFLEFGFLNTASNFEPSGVFYDNVLFETGAGGSGGTGGTGGSGGSGGTGGTGGSGGSGGTGGTGGGGGSPGICTDGELRCSADLPQIEICFNDFWEPYEECPPESVCQEEPDVSCVAPSVIVGDGIWDANGHQYVVVEFRGQTWDTANTDLSNQLSGFHLATITSQEEQDFVNNLVAGLISGELWLGGFQDPITELDPAAGWTWVTGEPWVYTNWLSSEPNDAIGVEQHLALDRGGWNDEGSAIGAVGGYLAESFDPVAP